MFDFPHPFGPTIAVTPGRKFSEVRSAKDLKPNAVRFFKYISPPIGEIAVLVKPKPQDAVVQIKNQHN
jgi:hypothetical protein